MVGLCTACLHNRDDQLRLVLYPAACMGMHGV